MALQLKRNEDGLVEATEEGFPVFVDEDGKDHVINVNKLQDALKSANAESAERRKKIGELEAEMQATQEKYKDLDPEQARKALQTLEDLKSKEMIEVGEVDKVKQAIKDGFEKRLSDQQTDYEKKLRDEIQRSGLKDNQIRQLLIKGAFDSSVYLKEKTVLPPEIAYKYFGDFFEVREINGQLRAVGRFNGDDIPSRKENPGELASTEEAIEFLVDKSAFKEQILRGQPSTGSGFFSPDLRASEQHQTLTDALYPSMKKK